MRDGTLKLVKMQSANAYSSMLSMSSWRQIGVRIEVAKALLQTLLSEVGILIFVIE
jgi:hypothetical protein